jgi:hypothetical protein
VRPRKRTPLGVGATGNSAPADFRSCAVRPSGRRHARQGPA